VFALRPEERNMAIRTFVPGDEVVQVGIYNEAAAALPKFKASTIDEVRRRLHGPDFDAGLRFYALVNDRPVAYLASQPNGRIGYPWCRRGHEAQAEPLLERALQALKERGLPHAFACYRADWAPQREFFEQHGFRQVREVVNFVMDLTDMPTPGARPSSTISALAPTDLTALPALGAGVFRTSDPEVLGKHYLQNPYFPASSAFVLRGRTSGTPLALGVVVTNSAYADPKQIDSAMPCYRLGAVGTEGMTAKRVNGLFSFVAPDNRDLNVLALDLFGHTTRLLDDTDLGTLAAQVPSDAPHLLRFYKQYFRRQGSFPVFEKEL
jgi:hypothetical protein